MFAKERHNFPRPNAISLLQFIREFGIINPRTLPLVAERRRNICSRSLRPMRPLLVLDFGKSFKQFIGGMD